MLPAALSGSREGEGVLTFSRRQSENVFILRRQGERAHLGNLRDEVVCGERGGKKKGAPSRFKKREALSSWKKKRKEERPVLLGVGGLAELDKS